MKAALTKLHVDLVKRTGDGRKCEKNIFADFANDEKKSWQIYSKLFYRINFDSHPYVGGISVRLEFSHIRVPSPPLHVFKSLILLCRKASLSDNIGSWVNKTEKLFLQWTFDGRTYHALTSGIRLILSKGAFISIESLLGSTSKPQDLIESILNDWLSGCGLRVNWTWTSSIKAMFAQVNGRNCSSLIDRSEHFLWQMNIFLSVHLCDIKSLELRRWQMTEHH